MTNLGGHDLEAVLEAFHGVAGRPAALLHRLHGQGLGPAARRPQGQPRRPDDARPDGDASGAARRARRRGVVARCRPRTSTAPSVRRLPRPRSIARRGPSATRRAPVPVPATLPSGRRTATAPRPRRRSAGSWASWRVRDLPLAARIVTTSPDVTVSTNLGGWVTRRERVQPHRARGRVPRRSRSPRPRRGARAAPASTSSWASPRTTCSSTSPASASRHELFGARLLPVGTLYDPFIAAASMR